MKKHIYLSPHLDDAIFSCGGLIFQQTGQGDQVLIVTICAGDPPEGEISDFAQELHERWRNDESPIRSRRLEDRNACQLLGAGYEHWEIPDCIYRMSRDGSHFYPSLETVLGKLDPEEIDLVEDIASKIAALVKRDTNIYVPMCFGGHVDHRLTRLAAESTALQLHYYRDLPYAGRQLPIPEDMEVPTGNEVIRRVSDEDANYWVKAMVEYTSQISTFWDDANSVNLEMHELLEEWGGIPILQPAHS